MWYSTFYRKQIRGCRLFSPPANSRFPLPSPGVSPCVSPSLLNIFTPFPPFWLRKNLSWHIEQRRGERKTLKRRKGRFATSASSFFSVDHGSRAGIRHHSVADKRRARNDFVFILQNSPECRKQRLWKTVTSSIVLRSWLLPRSWLSQSFVAPWHQIQNKQIITNEVDEVEHKIYLLCSVFEYMSKRSSKYHILF